VVENKQYLIKDDQGTMLQSQLVPIPAPVLTLPGNFQDPELTLPGNFQDPVLTLSGRFQGALFTLPSSFQSPGLSLSMWIPGPSAHFAG
jgi:hypothetical protein